MRVSLNWLKEYVDFNNISSEKLAEKLTMAGLAVDTIEYIGRDISGIFIGKVKEVSLHPNADKLSVCTVDVNENNKDLQIICGAPNVRKNQKVVVALPGAVLPGNFKIKEAKIRGVASYGMICSGQELGMDEKTVPEDQRKGILVLEDNAPLGENAKSFLGLDDVVFVLDLTPNRSDCLSIINIAYEVAGIVGSKVSLPDIHFKEKTNAEIKDIAVDIVESQLCERYVARVVSDVEIKSSPQWMQKRLQASGIRPINNVVDVTNYVLMEMGQPLHAFDYDKVNGGKIVVRRASKGEKIITLDEKERNLHEDMLLIADQKEAIAIAGVMGGYNTEVTDETKSIIIESAYFNPISVRKTSKELNLRSEASLRFEKGVDKERVLAAANRAVQLLHEVAFGNIKKEYVDNYPIKYIPVKLDLRVEAVNSIIGLSITAEEIKTLLEKIELKVESSDNKKMRVEIPSYRSDITREIDLIEEVARLYGYNNIFTTLPAAANKVNDKSKQNIIQDKTREALLATGAYEVITYSFINYNAYEKLNLPKNDKFRNCVRVANPLSEDGAVMRTTLVPNLLEVMVKNINRNVKNPIIFEIGHVFEPSSELLPVETKKLGMLVSGSVDNGWAWPKVSLDFYFLKGIIEELVANLGVEIKLEATDGIAFLHPGRTANIFIGEEYIGFIGETGMQVNENYDIENVAYVCEVNLDKLVDLCDFNLKYEQLPKYPAAERDLAIVVKEDIEMANVQSIIEKAGYPLLKKVELFDMYRGKQIPDGHKSLAFSLMYQSIERTLTDDEINMAQDKIKKQLMEEIDAALR